MNGIEQQAIAYTSSLLFTCTRHTFSKKSI